jgi:hypothetical protein
MAPAAPPDPKPLATVLSVLLYVLLGEAAAAGPAQRALRAGDDSA